MSAAPDLYLPRSLVEELAEERAREIQARLDVAPGLTRPIPFVAPGVTGRGISTQPSKEQLLRETRAWSAIAGRAIVKRLSSVTFYVAEERRTRDGTIEEERLDGHAMELAWKANPVFSTRNLTKLIAWHYVQTGEAYLQKVRDGIGVVREYWPMPTQMVYPIFNDEDIIAGFYVRTQQGKTLALPAEDVVRIWDPDPLTLYTGMGSLGPQALDWDGDRFRAEHLREHFKRDAIPRVVLETDKEAPDPTTSQRDLFEQLWHQRYSDRYGANTGVPAILPAGTSAKELAAHGGVAETGPIGESWRDQFLMAYGVPRSVLGDVVDANRAAAETNLYAFDLFTVEPIAVSVAEALTASAKLDYDPSLVVRYEPFVTPDKEFDLKAQRQRLDTKVTSINMERTEEGADPVPWGDEPVGTIADVPYDPDAARGEESPDDLRAGRSRARLVRVSEAFTAETAYARFQSWEKRYMAEWAKAQARAFEVQRRDAVRRLGEEWPYRAARISVRDIFQWEVWEALYRTLIEPIRMKLWEDVGTTTNEALGAEPFQFTVDRSRHAYEVGGAAITQINQTTQRKVAAILGDAMEKGESVDKVARRLNTLFRDRARARTIARTEVLKSGQAAQMDSFRDGLVEAKRWNQSFDEKVRDSHQLRDPNAVVPRETPFTLLDGARAMYPGDPNLGPENVCNCRCFMTPEEG